MKKEVPAYRCFMISLLILLGCQSNLSAQNEYPTAKNSSVKIDGGAISFIRPNAVGGWARGVNFYNLAASERFVGLGVYGNDDAMERFYIASGTSPWTSGSGLYILPNGNVGIGAVTPTYRLQVAGSAKWTGNASSYTEVNSNSHGQYLRQFSNDGTSISWAIRGYPYPTQPQAEFNNGGINVNGTVKAKEVNITGTGWADHVFAPEYRLMDLGSLKEFLEKNGHLPGIPTETEVALNGVNMGEINVKLLEKIEELTLYTIKQEEDIREQNHAISEMRLQIQELKQMIKDKP